MNVAGVQAAMRLSDGCIVSILSALRNPVGRPSRSPIWKMTAAGICMRQVGFGQCKGHWAGRKEKETHDLGRSDVSGDGLSRGDGDGRSGDLELELVERLSVGLGGQEKRGMRRRRHELEDWELHSLQGPSAGW